MNEILPIVSKGKVLNSTTTVAVYTTPLKMTAQFKAIYIANLDTATQTVTVTWYNKSLNTSFTIVPGGSLAAKQYVRVPMDEGLRLGPEDEIRVKADAANVLHAIVNVIELPGRSK